MSNSKIFKHPSTGDIQAVHQSFSFIAFFFPLLWLLFNGIWGLFFLLSIMAWGINFLLSAAGNANNGDAVLAVFVILIIFQLSMRIYLGFTASALKEKN